MFYYRPKNYKELFNLCHAQARNVIERIFGVVKKCWTILILPPKYDMSLQARIPAALAALHNFILDNDTKEHVEKDIVDPIPGCHLNPKELLTTQGELSVERRSDVELEVGWNLHEDIAKAMWDDYVLLCEQRSLEEELHIGGEDDDMEQDN